MSVRCAQRINICAPDVARGSKIGSAPGEPRTATLLRNQQIGSEPRPAAVAVWKWMNEDQSVMEAHGQLVLRKSFVFDPISSVVDDLVQFGLDAIALNAEIAFGRAIIASPSPNTIKHAAVKSLEKGFVKDRPLPSECPAIGLGDIPLFQFIEFAAQGNVRRNERLSFLGGQGRCVIIGIEQVSHFRPKGAQADAKVLRPVRAASSCSLAYL